MPDGQSPVDCHWTGEAEPRLLNGGPRDGTTIHVPAHMGAMLAVECPWGDGDVLHFASAEYDRDGNWVETRCTSTDDEPLVERPD